MLTFRTRDSIDTIEELALRRPACSSEILPSIVTRARFEVETGGSCGTLALRLREAFFRSCLRLPRVRSTTVFLGRESASYLNVRSGLEIVKEPLVPRCWKYIPTRCHHQNHLLIRSQSWVENSHLFQLRKIPPGVSQANSLEVGL